MQVLQSAQGLVGLKFYAVMSSTTAIRQDKLGVMAQEKARTQGICRRDMGPRATGTLCSHHHKISAGRDTDLTSSRYCRTI